jgi:hypothetical protein
MTRDDIMRDYKPNKYGRISAPGKFEGEMVYVPYFWAVGQPDEEDEGVYTYKVNADDRAEFPELEGKSEVWLVEDEQGFVCEVPQP